MPSRPTTAKRRSKQTLKQKYAKTREDAQLAGIVATSPEGAVRDERVDPKKQSEQRFPTLERVAITQGWAVTEEAKRKIIERLVEPFFEVPQKITVKDSKGDDQEITVPVDRHLLKENAKTLIMADRFQHEVDHPDDKPEISINNQINNTVVSWDNMTQKPVVIDPVEQATKQLPEVKITDEIVEPRPDGA